ncbi:MAG: hypothetical protein JWR63_185 [Conexibacter sp.]|nr:hypothetical protein [Conexibacter sp.]
MEENEEVIIEHPNRAKASSKAAKATVLLLLLVSVALMLIVTIGGWDVLQGAKPVQIAYILVYLIMAFYVAQWNRGVLPVAAALAIILLIFAAVAVPGWLDRDKSGFAQPSIDSGILALVTALLIPVQVLLIAFAMRAFNQAWNVEVERAPESRPGPLPA